MADIELSFGIQGGVGGATGELQSQLKSIIASVSKTPIELKVELNQASVARTKAQIKTLANYAKSQQSILQKARANSSIVQKYSLKNTGQSSSGQSTSSTQKVSSSAAEVANLKTVKSLMSSINDAYRNLNVTKLASGNEKFNASLSKTNSLYKSISKEYQRLVGSKSSAGIGSFAPTNFEKMVSEFNSAAKSSYGLLDNSTPNATKNLKAIENYASGVRGITKSLNKSFKNIGNDSGLESKYKRIFGMVKSMNAEF